MVYWADLLYPEPAAEARMEAADTQLGAEELPEIGLRWLLDAGDEEAAFIGRLADRIGYDELASDEPVLDLSPEPTQAQFEAAAAVTFEALPLPWVIKRRLMKVFLRDVHHYLFDVEFEPRRGDKHRIQTEIRRRAIDKLRSGEGNGGQAHRRRPQPRHRHRLRLPPACR